MKVVVDIPNWLYNAMMEHKEPVYSHSLGDAVRDGVPLPKGHGDLIDKKEVKKMIEEAKVNSEHSKTFAENIIKFAHAIIEADGEKE